MNRSAWLLAAAVALGAAAPTNARADAEEIVKITDIPAPARAALLREAAGAHIYKVEREVENGRTLYEGSFYRSATKHEVTVDAQGHVVKRKTETK